MIPAAAFLLTCTIQEVDTPLRRGLDYLEAAQNENGAFPPNRFGRRYVRGITGICVLALMAGGRNKAAQKGLDYLAGHPDIAHMYSHAYATLALCEGAIRWPRYRPAAQDAVRRIIQSQHPNGSWGYAPDPGSPRTETCMASIILDTLYAAHRAGIDVPGRTVRKAVRFLHARWDPQRKLFNNEIHPSPSYGATGMAVAALQHRGERDSDRVKQGLAKLEGLSIERITAHLKGNPFPGYMRGHFHFELAAYAMALYHGRRLAGWLPEVARRLADQIGEDGSWEGWFGKPYGTALVCLVLLLKDRPALTWFERPEARAGNEY